MIPWFSFIKPKKKVYKFTRQGEFVQEYDSITLAAKENKISVVSIVNTVKGRQPTAAGFIWRDKHVI